MSVKNMHNPFSDLTRFEFFLWLFSIIAVSLSYFLSGQGGVINLIASLIGATALIFLAKGYVIGQILCIIFALFYGFISFFFSYYGELITYVFMTLPLAVFSLVSWIRHPYRGSREVEISRLDRKKIFIMIFGTIFVTAIFYFVLNALNTANMFFSTASISTSFIAAYLTYCRSPYYALGYAANDVVLIILWILAAIEDISYLPMVVCFIAFLANDLYGFYNWKKMQRKQEKSDA